MSVTQSHKMESAENAYVDHLKSLLIDDDFIHRRVKSLLSQDYQQLLTKCQQLESEQYLLLEHLKQISDERDALAQENQALKQQLKAIKHDSKEALASVGNLIDENTALHIENNRLRSIRSAKPKPAPTVSTRHPLTHFTSTAPLSPTAQLSSPRLCRSPRQSSH